MTLVGVPGIGKSRLVYEFFRQGVETDPELIYWRQGRCLPYGDGVTYWAVAEMVKSHAGVLETDAAGAAGEKLGRAAEEAVGDDVRWVLPHLRLLLGLAEESDPGADRQAEAFAAWRRFFEGLAEQRPLVLVFEDLHWADRGLLDFLDHLAEWATGVPLLVVCTARPELLDRSPGWGGGKLNVTTLRVAPLSEEETSRLLGELLGRPVLPAEAQQALLTRAAGNPLYAEQFARVVAERGSAEDLPLPENVQGLIAARLDLLPAEEKRLLQDAAVVGRTFWTGPLAAMGAEGSIEQVLHALERKEFVRRGRRSSVADEAEYMFRHVLVRDVAYGQIPRSDRAEKHRRAAEWIDSLGRQDDHAEMLAYHYVSALELARAAGTADPALVEAARVALRRAGDHAADLSAFEAAARFYDQALELSPAETDRAQLLFRLGRAQFLSVGEGGKEPLEAGAERSPRAGRPRGGRRSAVDPGHERVPRGRPRCRARRASAGAEPRRRLAAVAFEGRGARDVRPVPDDGCGRGGHRSRRRGAPAGGGAGPAGGARVRAERPRKRPRPSTETQAVWSISSEALRIALEIESPAEILRAYNNLAALHADLGDLRRSSELLALGREAASRFGFIHRIRWFRAERFLEDYWAGRWDEALLRVEEFLAQDAASVPYLEPSCRYGPRHRPGRARRYRQWPSRHRRGRRRLPEVERPAGAVSGARLPCRRTRLGRPRRRSRGGDGRAPPPLARVQSHVSPGPWALGFAHAVAALGRQREFIEVASHVGGRTKWLDAADAVLAGDFTRAARVLEEIGSRPDEAYALLRSGTEAQVRRALDFYRSVGATRFVEGGEAMLAASA